MQPIDSPEALIASMTAAGNSLARGWMDMLARLPGGAGLQAWAGAPGTDPAGLAQLQSRYAQLQAELWNSMLARDKGAPAEPVVVPAPGDKRFAAAEWRENPYYDYLKQSYLLAARCVEEMVEAAPLDPAAKDRLRFAARQWVDASCPANFPATNPEAMRAAIESRGESLTRGLANLIADAGRGRISQTDDAAFEVGVNLATAPGAVVFENALFQLIQYSPSTATVGERPLVMVPPCINKFYILDLQPANSYVRYAVGQGHTVFMVSWRNVKADLGHLGWDDYVEQGVITALRTAREIAGSDTVNALGFCVGGTLLGASLAVLAARREALVSSATYLTTMLDFSEPGQIGVLIDEAGVQLREQTIGAGGILPGSDLAFVFSALRANDLIWPYVVNNYLKGGAPAAFDLLYWNADSTNLPGPMYCWYVRNTYLENRLRVPAALSNCGVPVDLGAIGLPSFILATREDHIVPWRSAYRSVGLLGGPAARDTRFVLGASGHVAGVINPPPEAASGKPGKRSYWSASQYPADPQDWLAGASEHPGSWWPEWSAWLSAHKGGERKARKTPGNRRHKPIEPAPGRYVKEKFNQ
jgi:polyhydroxyalkanoate synthase